MKWLIFAVPCVILISVILRHIIFAEDSARKFFTDVKRLGFRRSQLNRSFPTLLLGFCFVGSFRFVEFGIFWIALGIIAIAVPTFFLFHQRIDEDVEEMFSGITDETIARAIKKRRLNSIWKLALLSFWCFSWLPQAHNKSAMDKPDLVASRLTSLVQFINLRSNIPGACPSKLRFSLSE